SSKDISAEKIRAQVNGSPIQVQLTLKDYDSAGGTFDLGVESSGVRAGVISGLLPDIGSPRDTGIVRGAIRYTGSFANKAQGKFTGTLDLVNVQTRLKPLFQPLRALNGRISIDESGIDFQKLTASLVGFPVAASGRWRYRQNPQLLFEFAAPNLDITYLISQIDPELSEFYATLVADGKIALNKGRIKNFDFSDLTTNATIDHRVWRLTNLSARSAGGSIQGGTTIFDKPDTLALVADPKVDGVPIQSFLNWFNVSTTEMSGKVNFTGRLETIGSNDTERKQNLNGAFNLKIEDGIIRRMRILVQLLNLLDLSRWFTFQIPDLTKQGIRFRAITADFKVTNGIYSTDNLIVDSSDLRMTGAGKIDVPNDDLDFVVAVRPFAGIDTAMSYIPLLGRSIAAIKNSFLVASFHITGRIDEPTITPAPLGTLSEWFWGVLGIPKNMIGFGESEKKEPTNPAPEAPLR
ncbi:MAG TPA: AsmA-like C-terminal domain-containing protein, partial [Candidatus Binatia bacterium]|nr:AsmA-like C-terminal domain-containing protein [Candidatus Binatia bacterium]